MPSVQDQLSDRINKAASDQQQHRPQEIVEPLLEIGHRLRSLLRSAGEDCPQKKNDGYGGQDDAYQLVHEVATLEPDTTARRSSSKAPTATKLLVHE